jgi:hypothetical protein
MKATAQAAFPEGVLTYRVDTIQRLESHPAAYTTTYFKLYKKGDLVRTEKQSVNKFNPIDRQRSVEIRNKEGIYALIESGSTPNDYALFMSYDEEKVTRSRVALQGQLTTYATKATGEKSILLSMSTEKFIVTSSDKSDPIEVQTTKVINVPIGLFFDALRSVEGTPLQFTDSQYGWLNKYTIESIKAQSLADDLFRVDPKLKIMTTEQMLKELSDFK